MEKICNRKFIKPLFNAGVFCLRDTSNFLGIMERKIYQYCKRSDNDYCLNMDQASLNYLIFQNKSDVNFLDTNLIGFLKTVCHFLIKKH